MNLCNPRLNLIRRSTCAVIILAIGAPRVGADDFEITVTSRYNTQVRQPQNLRDFFAAHPQVHLKQ